MEKDFVPKEKTESEINYFITEEQYFEYYQTMGDPTFGLYVFETEADIDKV